MSALLDSADALLQAASRNLTRAADSPASYVELAHVAALIAQGIIQLDVARAAERSAEPRVVQM